MRFLYFFSLFLFSAQANAAGVPAKLSFSVNPSATASTGVPFTQAPVVAVLDEHGNLVTNDNSCIISLSLLGGERGDVLAGHSLFQRTTNGVANYSGTDLRILRIASTPGALLYQLMATPSGSCADIDPALSEQVSIDLAGVPSQLALVQAPGEAALNAPWALQPIVTVLDMNGDLVARDSSTYVIIKIEDGSPDGVLVGATAIPVTNGVANFAGLKVAGEMPGLFSYQISAVSPGLEIAPLAGVTQQISGPPRCE